MKDKKHGKTIHQHESMPLIRLLPIIRSWERLLEKMLATSNTTTPEKLPSFHGGQINND
jgi:hypothetical protein